MPNLKAYTFGVLILLVSACNSSIKYPDGGYDYPKHVAGKDTNFYYFPLKDVMPKRDSLGYMATYLLFKEFDEPNLSLKPLGDDVFRLQYSAALGGFYIITVSKNLIQIKKEIYHEENLFDEKRLSETEQKIYNMFSYHYPFDSLTGYRKKFIDSLRIADPKVLQPGYLLYLLKKIYNPVDPKKVFTTTTIKITDKDFNHIVETINKSGYWKMPYSFPNDECCMDGYSYGLEANTEHKYNFVTATLSFDSSLQRINFSKACQEIINYAHLNKEISLWHESKTDTTHHIVVQDVQLEDIKESSPKHKKKKSHLSNKDSTVQGSDTTKMP